MSNPLHTTIDSHNWDIRLVKNSKVLFCETFDSKIVRID